MKRKPLAGRYFLLDEIRGFAVICMVFFHAFYTCFETLSIGFFGDLINFFLPAEPFFAAGFIFISGMCGNFSKNPWKRTVILVFVAASGADYINSSYGVGGSGDGLPHFAFSVVGV